MIEYFGQKIAEGVIGQDLLAIAAALIALVIAVLVYLKKKRGLQLDRKWVKRIMTFGAFLEKYKANRDELRKKEEEQPPHVPQVANPGKRKVKSRKLRRRKKSGYTDDQTGGWI
jgi:hypothetical protein